MLFREMKMKELEKEKVKVGKVNLLELGELERVRIIIKENKSIRVEIV